MRWLTLVVTWLAVGCSSGCSAAKKTQAPTCQRIESGWGPAGTVPVKVEVVASGLEVPWSIVFAPNGDAYVSERPGRVRLIRGGALQPDIVLQLAGNTGGESGLLGLALHPQFGTNRWLYLYRTIDSGGRKNQVERWIVEPDGKSAKVDRVIFEGIAGAANHDGGRIRFGPDGMLYVGTGDASDPDRSAEENSPNGKILRLTPEGAVPSDNPRAGKAMFITGIRNTQGFDWLSDGRLVVSDHGPSGDLGRRGQDELMVAKAGDDLGWPAVSGCDLQDGTVPPLMTWTTAAPPGGLALYKSDKIPQWKDSVLVGTLGSKHLHRFVLSTDGANVDSHEVYFEGDAPKGQGRLRDVLLGPDGHVYVTTSNCDGRGACPNDKDKVLRIVSGP